MKKTLSILLAGAMVCSLSACSGKSTETKASATETAVTTGAAATEAAATTKQAAGGDPVFKIGVLQLVQHAALDASNEGFFAALDDAGVTYEADQQNAAGEQSACQTIAEKLVNDKDDLILAIATPAAQAAASVTEEIPILLTAVTDPAESGLVASNDAPAGNVSGASDLTPVTEQIDLLVQLIPAAKTVGILYCSAESNSVLQAEMAKQACAAKGLTCKEFTVSNSNEIQTVVESMIGKVDAIYAPTDNMIAAGMATVSMIATDNKLPIICGEAGMVKAGGLATYGIDYYQLGYLAGQQAVQILVEGKDVGTIPIAYLPIDKCQLTVNKAIADTLGVDITALTNATIVE
ncbi:MAG: ABC transporter substrate-binding protein [Hungatella sp.]